MLLHNKNMSRKEDDAELDFACEAVMKRASEHNLVALPDKCQRTGSNVVALEPSVRMLMKSTLLASLDTAVSLAFRELLKLNKRASPSTIFLESAFRLLLHGVSCQRTTALIASLSDGMTLNVHGTCQNHT